jgi:hypothetical protein
MSISWRRRRGVAGMPRMLAVQFRLALSLTALVLSTGSGFAGNTNSTNSNATTSTSTAGSTSSSGASSVNAGNAQSITYNDPAIPTNTTVNNVPNVYAPGLAAAGSEVCLGSISGGGAGAGFGVTIGGTFVDRECQLRLNARTLAVLGYPKAARETMCLDPDVRQAMAAAGTPCAADAYAASARYGEAAPTSQTAAVNPFSALGAALFGRQASAPQASAPQTYAQQTSAPQTYAQQTSAPQTYAQETSAPPSLNTNPFAPPPPAPAAQQAAAPEAAAPSQTAMANPAPGPTARAKSTQTATANPGKSKAHAKTMAVAQAAPVQSAPVQSAPVQDQPAQAAAESPDPSSDDAHPGCHKEYQLFRGWYEKCPE